MMENKILIKLTLPEFDSSFDIFIPVNEIIWKIKKMILKCACDLTNIQIDQSKEYILLNKDTCKVYNENEIIIDTDIRNSTELILIKKN